MRKAGETGKTESVRLSERVDELCMPGVVSWCMVARWLCDTNVSDESR